MEDQKNKLVLKRHSFYRTLFLPIIKLFSLIIGFKNKSHFKIKKDESYVVLSNHQTDFDGFLVMLSFNKLLYPVATDTLMSNGKFSKFLYHCFGIIPKKKGAVDFDANKMMLDVFKEGGSLLLFPEGNRTYAEFQFSFTKSFSKFIKLIKKPVILYNISGGTGCYPRFGNKRRKGPFYGKIRRILRYDDYKDLTDEELYKFISDSLKIYDSSNKKEYKSNKRAEYLERIFFVCPKCGKVECLVSKGNYIECKECDFKVEYTNNLHLVTNDKYINFTKTLDWYNYQIRYIRDFKTPDGVIFSDDNVSLYKSELYQKRSLVSKGRLQLYKDKLTIGDTIINIEDIIISSPIGGIKFSLSTTKGDFINVLIHSSMSLCLIN